MAFLLSRLSWGRVKALPQLEEGSSEVRSKRSSSSARSRKSLLRNNGDDSVTCQEASNYPMYDAADPEHNTAVPPSATPPPQRKSRLERFSQSLRSRCKQFYKYDDDGKPIVHSNQTSPSKKSIKSIKSVRFDSEHTIIKDTQAPASPISIPCASFLPELELPLSMLDIHDPSPMSLGLTARPVEEAPLTKMERCDDSFLEPVRSPLREIPPNLETPLPGTNLGMEVNPFDDVHKVQSPKAKQAASPEANAATEQTELATPVTTDNSKKSFPEVFPEVDALQGVLNAANDDLSAQYDADTESVSEPVKVTRASPESTKDQAAPSTDNNSNTPISAMKSDLGCEVVTLKPTVSSTSPPRQTTFHSSDSGESCVTTFEGVPGPQRTESIASQLPPLRLRRSQLRLGPRMVDITALKVDSRAKEYSGEVESDMSSMHLGSRASSTYSAQNKKHSTTICHSEEAPSVFSTTRAKLEGTDSTDGELLSRTLLSNEDFGMPVFVSHGHGQKEKQGPTSSKPSSS